LGLGSDLCQASAIPQSHCNPSQQRGAEHQQASPETAGTGLFLHRFLFRISYLHHNMPVISFVRDSFFGLSMPSAMEYRNFSQEQCF
jgi:hypothetical protein